MLTLLLDRVAAWPAPVVLALAGLLLFAESGTLVGLLLPGTTLLVTLGWWSAVAGLPAPAPLGVAAVATVAGALHGWHRGRRARTSRRRTRWHDRCEQLARRLAGWLGAPGSAVAVLMTGHWASAARTLTPRVAGAAGVPLRTTVPALAASGTAWAATLVLLGHEVGPVVAAQVRWVPFAVLPLVVGALLLRGRLSRRGRMVRCRPTSSPCRGRSAHPASSPRWPSACAARWRSMRSTG